MSIKTWSISEWYGKTVENLSADQLKEFALLASEKNSQPQPCPFKATYDPDAICNKSGGVCSIRPIDPLTGTVRPISEAQPATTCPNRFLEQSKEFDMFGAIAQYVFESTEDFAVVSEVGFLYPLNSKGELLTDRAPAGRIDWVIVNDARSVKPESKNLDWVAVETQAVYFSGASMQGVFDQYGNTGTYTADLEQKVRRPDWRSSSAKRLAPQLEAKGERFNRWGKKVAVVIDEAFWQNMVAPKSEPDSIDNADVIWFIVKYTSDSNLVLERKILSERNDAIQSLQATSPMNRTHFEKSLKKKLLRDS